MPPQASQLNPSGEDANPMRRRLPAEVITRKRKEVRQVEEKVTEDVRVDLKTAIALKPDARPKWLSKAFKMVEDGRAPSSELYAIITSRKFIGGLPGKIGRRLHEIVVEGIESFSEKQRRFLNSEDWALHAQFAGKPQGTKDDEGGDDAIDAAPADREEVDKKTSSKDPDAKDPAEETWVTAPPARIHQERNAREAQLAEERAKRKEREREEQEKWMEAQAEASQKKAREQQEAKRRQLEDEVDNSLSLLGDIASPPPANSSSSAKEKKARKDKDRDRDRDRDEKESRGRGRGRDGLSRSRSVKARSRSRRRKRSRSRGGRRRDRSGSKPKVDFNEALRRRLQEREASDTTRMAVVDPGHAQRWSSR